VRFLNGATQHRIMIFGPKDDGAYIVEFSTAWDAVLTISIPSAESGVVRYFQERMPYGLFVPDGRISAPWPLRA
jgi:hypothetical protein